MWSVRTVVVDSWFTNVSFEYPKNKHAIVGFVKTEWKWYSIKLKVCWHRFAPRFYYHLHPISNDISMVKVCTQYVCIPPNKRKVRVGGKQNLGKRNYENAFEKTFLSKLRRGTTILPSILWCSIYLEAYNKWSYTKLWILSAFQSFNSLFELLLLRNAQ